MALSRGRRRTGRTGCVTWSPPSPGARLVMGRASAGSGHRSRRRTWSRLLRRATRREGCDAGCGRRRRSDRARRAKDSLGYPRGRPRHRGERFSVSLVLERDCLSPRRSAETRSSAGPSAVRWCRHVFPEGVRHGGGAARLAAFKSPAQHRLGEGLRSRWQHPVPKFRKRPESGEGPDSVQHTCNIERRNRAFAGFWRSPRVKPCGWPKLKKPQVKRQMTCG